VDGSGVDSVTQYELWKAVWSSLNDGNFHELDWALQRHNAFADTFAPLTFVGNHDVTRIASKLERPEHLAQALVLLLTIGGVPSVYAGDELGYLGVKEDRAGGDDAVRPEFTAPPGEVDGPAGDVLNLHRYLIGLRRRNPWLHEARTTQLHLTNRNYVFETRRGDDVLIVALNVDDEAMSVPVAALTGHEAEVVAGSGAPPTDVLGQATVPPHGWLILRPR
jgi:glycosidase